MSDFTPFDWATTTSQYAQQRGPFTTQSSGAGERILHDVPHPGPSTFIGSASAYSSARHTTPFSINNTFHASATLTPSFDAPPVPGHQAHVTHRQPAPQGTSTVIAAPTDSSTLPTVPSVASRQLKSFSTPFTRPVLSQIQPTLSTISARSPPASSYKDHDSPFSASQNENTSLANKQAYGFKNTRRQSGLSSCDMDVDVVPPIQDMLGSQDGQSPSSKLSHEHQLCAEWNTTRSHKSNCRNAHICRECFELWDTSSAHRELDCWYYHRRIQGKKLN
ncbi:hypothetical protein FRB90_003483 [Tulasnella sp. 427]|nr:hypothetical protein FRB90_003483 [Tulasnella sp. 427]